MTIQTITTPQDQRGAALIVVLLVLILIILAGAIAVRKSNTDLRLATASQVDSLLFIGAEQPNAKLEQQAKAPGSDIFSTTKGLLGYFMSEAGADNAKHELVLCYRPKERDSLSLFKAGILQPNDTNPAEFGRLDGDRSSVFCNPTKSDSYTSDRNAVMTQMAITRGTSLISSSAITLGADLHDSRARSYSLNVDSAAALPAYGSASDSTITGCFQKPLTQNAATTETVETCLTNAGIPSKTVTQNYIAQYQEPAPTSSSTVNRGSVVATTGSGSGGSTSGSEGGESSSTDSGG